HVSPTALEVSLPATDQVFALRAKPVDRNKPSLS
ncbi:MAG: hypothetical protein ACI892_001034, partial [Marinobacter maritimus]